MADDSVQALRALWSGDDQARADVDEACGPQKTCRNMKDITFDGYAEPGSDIGSAWRSLLAREGKLSNSGGSIRDLVLGPRDAAGTQ